MWLALTPGTTINNTPPIQGRGWNGAARVLVEVEDPSEVVINAHIDMRTADGSLTIGWAPSQVDMLAEDWTILDSSHAETV
jgi:hypothetical protein